MERIVLTDRNTGGYGRWPYEQPICDVREYSMRRTGEDVDGLYDSDKRKNDAMDVLRRD
jgi:hypothetical protein